LKKAIGWILAIIVGLPLLAVLGFMAFGPTVSGPFFDFLTGRQIATPAPEVIKGRFALPAGLRLGVFAEKVANARMMEVTPAGDILVSSYRSGDVILLYRDANADGRSDGRKVLLSGLNVPHGLALYDGWLYVAETDKIIRARFDAITRTIGKTEQVFGGLPAMGNHRTRTIAFGPDGLLYVSIGSSCNVCAEEHPYRAAMIRMSPTGGDVDLLATGLRNTVGFDWQPGTNRLYGTDNARDLLGDDIPQDELNLIVAGADYGWPHAFDQRVPDPDFGPDHMDKVAASTPPVHGLGAHHAPLGITFMRSDIALVALHGSWNRTTPAGYKVVALKFNADGTIDQRDWLTGFLGDAGDVIGRPVDIAVGADGAIYVSDDYAGVIYRVADASLPVAGYDIPEHMVDIGKNAAKSAAAMKADVGRDMAKLAAAVPKLSGQSTGADADITLGAMLFATNACASCHIPQAGADAPVAKPLRNLKARYRQKDLEALLDIPPSPMPRPDLTAAERAALAKYLLAAAG